MNYKFILIALSTILFTGCISPSIEDQRKDCLAQKKKFYVKKVFILRSGEYEKRGFCENS